MRTPQPTTTLEDQPIPVKAKLAAAWTSFMFLYVYVDILGFFVPRSRRLWVFGSGIGLGEGALPLYHRARERFGDDLRLVWMARSAKELAAARAARDYATSDAIRDELAARGWDVFDSPDGSTVKPKVGTR